MARKGVLTKGTQVWILHGDATKTLTRIDCIKAIDLGAENFDEIVSDCIDSTDVPQTYFSPAAPSDGSITLDEDDKNPTHPLILELSKSREEFVLYVGLSQSGDAPTLVSSNDDVELPGTRKWFYATATLRGDVPDFSAQQVVRTIPMRRQSGIIEVPVEVTP